jgi:hypothetical protein
MLADDASEATLVGDAGQYKIEEEKTEQPGSKISDNASTQGTSHEHTHTEKSEASGETGSTRAAGPTGGKPSLAKPSKAMARVNAAETTKLMSSNTYLINNKHEESPRGINNNTMRGSLAKPKGGYQPVRSRPYSPPMIQEYDPNEQNAKTRAKIRAEAIKKREAALEIDKGLYPEHPTPWKGRPAAFFMLHAPRKGGGAEKILNNT